MWDPTKQDPAVSLRSLNFGGTANTAVPPLKTLEGTVPPCPPPWFTPLAYCHFVVNPTLTSPTWLPIGVVLMTLFWCFLLVSDASARTSFCFVIAAGIDLRQTPQVRVWPPRVTRSAAFWTLVRFRAMNLKYLPQKFKPASVFKYLVFKHNWVRIIFTITIIYRVVSTIFEIAWNCYLLITLHFQSKMISSY